MAKRRVVLMLTIDAELARLLENSVGSSEIDVLNYKI
jgi:hypothetical protein